VCHQVHDALGIRCAFYVSPLVRFPRATCPWIILSLRPVCLVDARSRSFPRPPTSSTPAQAPPSTPILAPAQAYHALFPCPSGICPLLSIGRPRICLEFAISPIQLHGNYSAPPSSSIVDVSRLLWLSSPTPPSVHFASSGQQDRRSRRAP
jgi:hypothetical protein